MKETTYSLIICGCNVDLSEEDYNKLFEQAKKMAEFEPSTTRSEPCENTVHEFTSFKIKKKHWENDFSLSKWEEE